MKETGICDTCNNSYLLGDRITRCGDCGNCGSCCSHKITLIGNCMNCGEIYGRKVTGTLESIYNDERVHICNTNKAEPTINDLKKSAMESLADEIKFTLSWCDEVEKRLNEGKVK